MQTHIHTHTHTHACTHMYIYAQVSKAQKGFVSCQVCVYGHCSEASDSKYERISTNLNYVSIRKREKFLNYLEFKVAGDPRV